MENTYIALDFETTGVDPILCSIIEIGAAKFDGSGNVLDKFSEFAQPGVTVPAEVKKLTGISDQMLESARKPFEVWDELLNWSGKDPIFVSHNAKFEARFIKALYLEVGGEPDLKFICTYEVAKNRLKDLGSYKLIDLVPDESGGRHRALADALACIELYKRLASTYKSGNIPHNTYLKNLSQYEMFDKPTNRQTSYIESLGGDPLKPKTKGDASKYIDVLKANIDQTQTSSSESGSALNKSKSVINQIFQTILTLIIVTVLVFWGVSWLLG